MDDIVTVPPADYSAGEHTFSLSDVVDFLVLETTLTREGWPVGGLVTIAYDVSVDGGVTWTPLLHDVTKGGAINKRTGLPWDVHINRTYTTKWDGALIPIRGRPRIRVITDRAIRFGVTARLVRNPGVVLPAGNQKRSVAVYGSVLTQISSASLSFTTADYALSAVPDNVLTARITSYSNLPTGVTWNTTSPQALSSIASVKQVTSEDCASIWHRVSPTAATTGVTVGFADTEEIVVSLIGLEGVDTANPVRSTGTTGPASTTGPTLTLTSCEGDGLIIDCLGTFNLGAAATGSGQTVQFNIDNGSVQESGIGSSKPTNDGTGTVTMSYATTGPCAYAAVAYRPASSFMCLIAGQRLV